MTRGSVVVAVTPPEVPVIVILLVPVAAVLLALNVSVLDALVGFVASAAVTPAGKPDTASFTLPVNPYRGVTTTVAAADLPVPRSRLPGIVESEKLGVCTVSAICVVLVMLPDVPVIVTVVDALAAVLAAVKVSTLLPEVGFVPHFAVTPAGNADVIANLTVPENPPASTTVIVVEPEAPGFIATSGEDADNQKPGICLPARSSIRSWPVGLPHPVTRSYPGTALYQRG